MDFEADYRRIMGDEPAEMPEDIAVIGFDNRELAAFTSPGMTTIAQPNFRAGELAAEMLLGKIEHTHKGTRAIGVPMSLMIRNST